MATPRESVTTVSGRRCTRSRARTAATSTTTSITSTTTSTTSSTTSTSTTTTTTISTTPPPPPPPAPVVTSAAPAPAPVQSIISQAPQAQSSAATEAPPPPPPPPPAPSSTQVNVVPDVVPATTSAAAAAPSAIGTDSPISSSAPRPSLSAIIANSPPVGQAPTPGQPIFATPTIVSPSTAANDPIVSAAAETAVPLAASTSIPTSTSVPALIPISTSVPTLIPTLIPTSTSSDSNAAASISNSPVVTESPATAAPVESPVQSSIDILPVQPTLPPNPSDPTSSDPLSTHRPGHPESSPTGVPSGGSAGIISPEQGSGDGPNLTISSSTGRNIGGIVGGVVGGLFALVLICGLLFFCLRKRRSREPSEKKRQWMNEKEEASSRHPAKVQAIPAAIALFFAKLNKTKAGPAEHPYRSQNARHSGTSSVYSTTTNGPQSRSMDEPPSKFRQQLRDIGGRMPSLKRSRTLLQQKPDSFVVGSRSPFIGIVDDPVARNSKSVDDPFADPKPEPLEPPKNLFVLNPDPNSAHNSPKLQKEFLEGLRDQQRAPTAPKPAIMSDRVSGDSLGSIMNQLETYNGSGTPEWLRDPHKRTQSASTALASHPPSTLYTPSIYGSAGNPFLDPTDVPPVPTQPLPPNPPIQPTNTYNASSSFNPTSTAASRQSDTSFYFGEPGPSRPTTRMFAPPSSRPITKMFAPPPRRPGRQSDPFDLDLPEVLGLQYDAVPGRKEVVTRQNSRRRSSVPNWIDTQGGPYERASAVPDPLRNPNSRR
ncbi:hypothetical protein K504DRAFT_184221 [Pleomassaria siparia CBS 279.74]|uniref:Uncharacterized protein n=1 Tax=Pleomassaria siparia CBS 279.74 TaxID=1314801 RepID=A0A6G1JR81_9PLEO|nr:hypothetical protein K504DRAFT_184221 [Pleomassaria siparia CBS 279.74]